MPKKGSRKRQRKQQNGRDDGKQSAKRPKKQQHEESTAANPPPSSEPTEEEKFYDAEMTLEASPNKQTRSRRRMSDVRCEENTVERSRIAKICKTFLKSTFVPCSVYGRGREEEYRGYYFCDQCDKADREEAARPGHFINRTIEGGRYKCQAYHTNLLHPTFTNGKSKYIPEPPPPELFCQPTCEELPVLRRRRNRHRRRQRHKNRVKTSARFHETKAHPHGQIESILFRHRDRDDMEDQSEPNPVNSSVNIIAPPSIPEDLPEPSTIEKENPESPEPKNPQDSITDATYQPKETIMVESVDDNGCDEDEDYWFDCLQLDDKNRNVPDLDKPVNDQANSYKDNELLRNTILELRKALTIAHEKIKKHREESKRKDSTIAYWKRIAEEERSEKKKLAEQTKPSEDKLPKSCYENDDRKSLVAYMKSFIESKVSRMDATSRHAAQFFTDIAQMLFDKTIHGGQLFACTYQVFRKYVRDNVFTPFKILGAMDIAGGPLNFRGLELLRSVETDGVPYQQTLIPSTSCMQECAATVNKFGALLAPYRMLRNTETGAEGFTFRAADVMAAILVAGHLLNGEAQERNIYLSQSIDGALFTKNLGHVLGGLKFNDVCNLLQQSRHSVFPILCVCQRESETLVRSLFRMMMVEIREGAKIVLPSKFGILEIKISTNCDMSCEWKLLGRGGASQQATYPCSKCVVRSGELHRQTKPASECKVCIKLGHDKRPNWICRHHKICSKEHLKKVEEDLDVFKKEMPLIAEELKDIWADSKVIIQQDPRCVASDMERTSLSSVHFDLQNASVADRREYAKILTNDLSVRDLDLGGSLEDRQKRLKASHVKEWWYHQAMRVTDQFKNSDKTTALVYMMDAVPCILHMENRMGLKLLTMLLREGLEHVKNQELPWIDQTKDGGMATNVQDFQDMLNQKINSTVLGSDDMPTQWQIPYDQKAQQIATICMDNVRIRRMIDGFGSLIDLCTVDEDRRTMWKDCLQHYKSSMQLVNIKRNLTDDEIYAYQREADEFFAIWVDLHGETGITNYAHLIGSGHVMEYLLHWRNLSSHAQQGWEGKSRAFSCLYVHGVVSCPPIESIQ